MKITVHVVDEKEPDEFTNVPTFVRNSDGSLELYQRAKIVAVYASGAWLSLKVWR